MQRVTVPLMKMYLTNQSPKQTIIQNDQVIRPTPTPSMRSSMFIRLYPAGMKSGGCSSCPK